MAKGRGQRYCKDCQDWYPSNIYPAHMKQHNVGKASYELHVPQYSGTSKSKGEDYMICILHQKKIPCKNNGCNGVPFGYIRKSLMMKYFRDGQWKWHDRYGHDVWVPIDTEKREVTLFGVLVKLKV